MISCVKSLNNPSCDPIVSNKRNLTEAYKFSSRVAFYPKFDRQ